MIGGASHIDLYDPKPNAPDAVRGPFRPIATSVPGLRLGELLPELARQADKFSLIRSMTSLENEHEVGHYFAQSGSFRWSPRAPAVAPPGFGSIVEHELGPRAGMPAFVQLGQMLASAAKAGMGGVLGRPFDPLVLLNGTRSPFDDVAENLPEARLIRRRRVLHTIDRAGSQNSPMDREHARVAHHVQQWERAADMLLSPGARRAFDLNSEPASTRDAYGPGVGQRMLLARRLIEAGVRFVTVVVFTRNGWDHHPEIFPRLKEETPPYDRGYATLLEDLAQRGLLDETLVVSMGEFGRTPMLNDDPRGPGRDHWNRCYSVTIGGGGVKTGTVLGASDGRGAYPIDRPVTVADLARTIHHALGIDADRVLHGMDGRPFQIVPDGAVIRELL